MSGVGMPLYDVPLGPFRLTRLIGIGGAGEVWEGRHVQQGVPVAVKVITATRAREARYREAFANEVRAVAGLDHPGVVVVFDTGVVDARAAAASEGRMVTGSPYLAMELATGGSLRTSMRPNCWSELRDLLQWLLDVFAHAHAHGVIHRDLKPGNVLVFEEPAIEGGAAATRLRLADFGLAHAMDRADRGMRGTAGTPIFMAPEQFRGLWRDFGPWTDLYALGCLAWTLASGVPPFRGPDVVQLMESHLHAPLPVLVPRFSVPDGFAGWVHRLMHKEPELRFQRSADAAYALGQLGDVAEVDASPANTSAPAPLYTLIPSWSNWGTLAGGVGEGGEGPLLPPDGGLSPRWVPPLPETWRTPAGRRASMRLVGAGLGLYGMREVPLVGRERERDRIWEALQHARATGEVRACLLRGSAGTGKSRLAEWVSQRADEVGNAVVVRASYSPGGGHGDGLARMVAAALGCTGMTRSDMARRIERFLALRGVDDPYERSGLLELVWPLPEAARSGEQPVVRFGSANERYAMIGRLFGYLSQGGVGAPATAVRPVILWLDDVQWGADALGLAAYLLSRTPDPERPVLVLMTARDEALEDRPVERRALARVQAHAQCLQLDLVPLDVPQRRELVEKLLMLEGPVAAQVEERTGGNPLFAVQLVGDWVQRGVLEVGATGFVLKRGEQAALPDDIHALWADRISRVVEGHPPSARAVLELAALLGSDVDEAEWRGACNVAGLDIPASLMGELLVRRLARLRPGGWSFAHGMMRESLERSAHEQGRAHELHRAAATTLQIHYDVARRPGLAERLGLHLFHCGKRVDALEPLLTGARERRAMSDYPSAMRLLELRERALTEEGTPGPSPAWGEGWVLQAEILVAQGHLDEAIRVGLRAIEHGVTHGWTHLLGPAYRMTATAASKQGHNRQAEQWVERGEEAAKRAGDHLETARCLLVRANVGRLRGRYADAMRLCEQALARFAAHEERRGQADVLAAIASVCRAMGDLEGTERHIREAIPLFEAVGARFGVGSAQNTLGDVLRARGAAGEAEALYLQSADTLRRLGSPEHQVPMLNLGLLLLEQGRYAEARERLEPLLAAMRRSGRRALEAALHAALLPCVAHVGDWEAWDAHLAGCRERLAQTGFVDGDIAAAAESAGALAELADQPRRARVAFELARGQWSALGDAARADAVSARIASLS